MDTQGQYTEFMPDGRPATFDDVRPGWWIQVYVGAWPYDTACGTVTAVHGGGVTAQLDGTGSRFIPTRRMCSVLRPTDA